MSLALLLDMLPSTAALIFCLRWTLLVLSAINLVWLLPGAWQAMRGSLGAASAWRLAVCVLILATVLFQSSYLFEGVQEIPHWRIAANVGVAIIGNVLLMGAGIVGARELDGRYHLPVLPVRIVRQWRKK